MLTYKAALTLVLLHIWCVTYCTAQFPVVCLQNITSHRSHDDPTRRVIRYCCPTDSNGLVCGGSSRGYCRRIRPTVEQNPEEPKFEDRYAWPTNFVTHQCYCNKNYYGYDCSQCKFGYTGRNCDKRIALKRRNIHSMDDADIQELKDAMIKAKHTVSDYATLSTSYRDRDHPTFKSTTYYDYFVYLHYYAAREPVDYKVKKGIDVEGRYHPLDYAHFGPGFPSWHRLFLLKMERVLQKLSGNPKLTIPYWDWVGDGAECSVCTDRYFGENDEQGFLSSESGFADFELVCSNATETIRKTGEICNVKKKTGLLKRRSQVSPAAPTLPTLDDAVACMNLPVYDNPPYNASSLFPGFRNCLDGFVNKDNKLVFVDGVPVTMHGQVHAYFFDALGELPAAANDPIFYLHHSNVDRLFEAWLRAHDSRSSQGTYPRWQAPPGHNWRTYMVPFFPVETNGDYFGTSDRFGYTYDSYATAPDQEESLSGSWKQGLNAKTSPSDVSSPSSSRIWVIVLVGFLSVAAVAAVLTIGIKRMRTTLRNPRGCNYVPIAPEVPKTYGTVG